MRRDLKALAASQMKAAWALLTGTAALLVVTVVAMSLVAGCGGSSPPTARVRSTAAPAAPAAPSSTIRVAPTTAAAPTANPTAQQKALAEAKIHTVCAHPPALFRTTARCETFMQRIIDDPAASQRFRDAVNRIRGAVNRANAAITKSNQQGRP